MRFVLHGQQTQLLSQKKKNIQIQTLSNMLWCMQEFIFTNIREGVFPWMPVFIRDFPDFAEIIHPFCKLEQFLQTFHSFCLILDHIKIFERLFCL